MIFSTTRNKFKANLHQEFGYSSKMYTAILLVAFTFMHICLFAQDTGNTNTVKVTEPVSHSNADSVSNATAPALPGKKKIYLFELTQDIFPAAWRIVKRAVGEAEKQNADYIIMRLNTFGGMADIADSIRTKLLKAKPITVVFVDNNAASAGALISIACDSIYMNAGASIGAATVVGSWGEQLPDKYQSYMRSTMRATAEAQGRDPLIAEAMVDNTSSVPGVIDSGFTLTLTTSEAIQNGYCEGEATSIEDVIKLMGISDYELITHKKSTVDDLIAFFTNPIVSVFLILVVVGGIYFEMQTPGVGFPLAAALVAGVLYFAPLYLEGLAENWEILIFLAGVGLLAVEIFVLPGFGIAGIMGIVLVVSGLTLSLIRNVLFDFTFASMEDIAIAFFRVVIALLVAVVLFLFFGEKLMFKGPFGKLVLADAQNHNEGWTSQSASSNALIGKTGTTVTDLRPAGTVQIGNERYDVISDGEHIEKNTSVKVIKAQGNYLVVGKA